MNNKKFRDRLIKIILIIIIIILLIHNCVLIKKNQGPNKVPSGNIDIIEINCDNNQCKPVNPKDDEPNDNGSNKNNDNKTINSLSFSQSKFSVKTGDSLNIVAIIKPSSLIGSKLTWSSSDNSIARVDGNGKVTGIKEGTVTITVTSANGKKATCSVTIAKNVIPVERIELSHNEVTIEEDENVQITANVFPENATDKNIIWVSSDESIARVDSNGKVTGIKEGTVTITAKTIDGKVQKSCIVKVEMALIDDSLNVYDKDKSPVNWKGATDLKIFSKSYYTLPGVIAPESEDIYQFEVKNNTIYNLKYQINFLETNNYHINMKYKLKKNDTYLIDHYVSANELNVSDILLGINEKDTYYLEWKWISSSNDTAIGKNPDANYRLKLEIIAESTD